MKVKSLFILVAFLFSFQSMAQSQEEEFNSTCRTAYNTAYNDLRNAVYQYEIDYIDHMEFAGLVASIGTTVKTARAICYLLEDPNNVRCVKQYKKRYKKLRGKINLAHLIFNKQPKVEWNVVEDITSEFSNIFTSLSCH